MPVRLKASLISPSLVKVLLPLLCLYGCATANSPAITNPDSISNTNDSTEKSVTTKRLAGWMQEAVEKESNEPFKPTPYSIDDLGISLVLPGKPIGEIQDTTTSKFFSIDIGSGERLGCEVYYIDFDPAYSITRVAEINIAEAAKQFGKISNINLYFADSGAYDNRPYHALEWMAYLGERNTRELALFKYRLAIIGDFGLVCQHAKFGYRKTFENAFKYLVENFKYEKSDNQTYLVELASMSLNNKVVGFYLEKNYEDVNGDTIVSSISSMLIPITNQTVTSSDKNTLTYSTPQGEVINSFKSSVQNSELAYDLALNFDRSVNAWVVSGEFKGKSFEKTLQHDSYIDSALGQRIVLRQLAESEEANSSQIFFWNPDINPAEITSSTLNLSEKTGDDRELNYNIGPIAVTGIVDSNGSMKQSTIDAGSQLVVIDRLWLDRE